MASNLLGRSWSLLTIRCGHISHRQALERQGPWKRVTDHCMCQKGPLAEKETNFSSTYIPKSHVYLTLVGSKLKLQLPLHPEKLVLNSWDSAKQHGWRSEVHMQCGVLEAHVRKQRFAMQACGELLRLGYPHAILIQKHSKEVKTWPQDALGLAQSFQGWFYYL